ncbi:discoidin domain-containing protein, partial [bacterium]|nr:discoidin domain-containing protein [bacterium]
AFWQYGDAAAQPRSDTIFSAQNAGNGRVLQSHLPWGNSNVYWDAGNSSDRIEKGAAPAEFEGSWQHWAFTKNQAAGTMKIYHNGALWHSGGGGLGLAGIASLVIGSGDGFEYYDGMIDDFAIWDTELSAGEIARIATSANALVFSPGTVKATLTNDAGRLSPGGDGAIGTSIIAPASGNIAPGGTATQLTTVNNAPGPRAIDGNTDGNWGAGSVTHTANSSPSWWQVELLTEQIIDDIVLWNRTDCCANRLSNFRVSVLDAGENEVWGEDFFTTAGFAPTEFLVGVPDGTEGQFVRVDKLGPGRDGWVLSLAEVEVLTPLGPSDYLQGVDAILTIEMDALTGYADKLIVSGNVALDGVLDLRYINGFPPTITTYDVLDWGGELTGEFSQILLPDMSQIDPEGRYYFDFSELYNEGWITAGRIPEPTSLALLGLGALALRRRRRKA